MLSLTLDFSVILNPFIMFLDELHGLSLLLTS